MTEIPAFFGECRIASLNSAPNPYVGISGYVDAVASVSLNQPDQTWDITSQPNDQGLRFSIGGFPYTGVDNETSTVISSPDAEEDVQWYVVYREAQDAYSVEAGYDRSLVWTVSDTSDPFSTIVVSTIHAVVADTVDYLPSQLFKPAQLAGLD